MTASSPSRYRVVALPILAALVLRGFFFVGFVNGYGEESIHLRDALAVMDGNYLTAFEELKDGSFSERTTDMSHLYRFRVPVYFPAGLSMRLLGCSDAALSLWFMLCSLVLVLLTFDLGLRLYDDETGFLGALILAVFLFDVIWASRVNADLVLSLFFYVALWLILAHGTADKQRAWVFALAGVVLGFAYLTKIVALVLIPLAMLLAWRRGRVSSPLAVLVGFFVVFLLENLLYYQMTDVSFLRYRTAVAGIEKNVFEVFPFEPAWSGLGVTLHTYTDALLFSKLLLGLTEHPFRSEYFAIWGWLALAGIVYSIWKRQWIAPLAFLYLFAYFELSFSTLRWENGTHWYQIFKEPKYFLIALPLTSILAAQLPSAFLRHRVWTVAALAVLGIVSLRSTLAIHRQLAPELDHMRAAATYAVREGLYPLYVDPFTTDLQLRLFSRDRLRGIRLMSPDTTFPHNAYVIVDGSRGIGVSLEPLKRFYEREVPVLAGDILERREFPRFSLLQEFPSRGSNLRIYRIENAVTERTEPPVLELYIAEQNGLHVTLNGFVDAQAEDRYITMALYLNGELVKRQSFFPFEVTLRQLGESVIRVVATDAYGSSTTREVVAVYEE